MSASGRKADVARIDVRSIPDPKRKWIAERLFVVGDAATLIADSRLERLLGRRLPRLWKIIVHSGHGAFRRTLNCVKGSLAYRVVTKSKGANINADHAGAWKHRELPVRRVEAGNEKIAVVKLLVFRIAERAQCPSLVGLERGDSAIEHRSRFLGSPELVGTNQVGGQNQRQHRKHRHEHITHGVLA